MDAFGTKEKLTDVQEMCTIYALYTHGENMRTNIVIDDSLMNQALMVSGFKTKKETVEAGLKLLISLKKQAKIRY